jgi:hypothetical protein
VAAATQRLAVDAEGKEEAALARVAEAERMAGEATAQRDAAAAVAAASLALTAYLQYSDPGSALAMCGLVGL